MDPPHPVRPSCVDHNSSQFEHALVRVQEVKGKEGTQEFTLRFDGRHRFQVCRLTRVVAAIGRVREGVCRAPACGEMSSAIRSRARSDLCVRRCSEASSRAL